MKNQLNLRHVKQFSALALGLSLVLPLTMATSYAANQSEDVCEAALLSKKKASSQSKFSNIKIETYLQDHRAQVASGKKKFIAEKLTFEGVEGRDVYNPATPFVTTYRGKEIEVLMARVEPRENHESEVWFFTEVAPNHYRPIEGMPKLKMEDPFWTEINGEIVTGGVQTYPDPLNPGQLAYGTVFFRDFGKGLEFLGRLNGEADKTLTPFTKGPDRMKDIRLLDMKDGRILVATRPQSSKLEEGGRGRVGLVFIGSLEELNSQNLMSAQIIHGQVGDDEWIGVNQMHLRPDGKVDFVAHVARYDESRLVRIERNNGKLEHPRDYWGVGFQATFSSGTHINPNMLGPLHTTIERKDIDNFAGSAKDNDLINVVFNGGRNGNTYFVGLGDAEAYRVTAIED